MPGTIDEKLVAVVAGATRGAGRGIARALGELGATVYCTGRSVRGEPSVYRRPETIEETAELVTAAGGVGIPVRVDHTVEAEVVSLFQRVESEQGGMDVLVDSVAGEDPALGRWTPLWKTDLDPEVLRRALFSHLLTARHAAALMVASNRGRLLVEVTEGDMLFGGGNAQVDMVKTGLKALAVRLAQELRPHRIAAIAITPGFLRSESMLEHFGVTEATWRDGGAKDPHFLHSETPLFIGRAVAALAGDPDLLARSGHVLSSWELARDYHFTDADGSRPDWGEHFRSIIPTIGLSDDLRRYTAFLDHLLARARWYAGGKES